MGLALPGAIAAAAAYPDRKVVAVVGDGDFMMNVQEMETAHRLGSNICVLIWEDHEFGLISWKQQEEFGRQTNLSFGNPDWEQLAQSFGWLGEQCIQISDFPDALNRALRHPGPALVVIPIDYSENMKLTKQLGRLEAQI